PPAAHGGWGLRREYGAGSFSASSWACPVGRIWRRPTAAMIAATAAMTAEVIPAALSPLVKACWAAVVSASPMSPGSCPAASMAPSIPVSAARSEEHTSELQSRFDLVCRLLLEKKNEG